MATTQKKWAGGVLGATLVILVLVGLASRDQAPEVQTVRATHENLNASITSNGKVEPIEPYTMRAELATFVQQANVVEGQAVRRGQLMLRLDSSDARAQLAAARADLLAAQDDLRAARAGGPPNEVAQLEGDLRKAQVDVEGLERQQEALKQLVAKHAATQEELDAKQLDLERARVVLKTLAEKKQELARRASLDAGRMDLRVQQDQAQIHALDAKVRSAEVTSPVDGTLYSLPVRAGDYMQVGAVLAEIADLRRVRVRAFVDEPDLGVLAPGQTVEVTWDAMPSRLWTGQTEQIPRQVVARGTRSVGEVLCSVDNSNLELIPNVNVNVRILVREKTGVLVVPRAAVRADGTHHYVFLVDRDRLHRREVTVGIASATRYEVLAGLFDGAVVALPGEVELRDGMEVRHTEPR
jgi:HlyD family secretion protein